MKKLRQHTQDKCFQDILVYISRTFSLTDFIHEKIVKQKGEIFAEFEIEETLEAFSIKVLCDWEWLVERTIINCLIKDTSALSAHLNLNLPKTITYDVGFAILNGVGYFDIKSTGNLKGLTKKVLTDDLNPFAKISKDRCDSIDDFYIIRNYIAHRSEASKRSYKKLLLDKKQITDFIEPGKYLLRGPDGPGDPFDTNFNLHGCAFWVSALDIWQFLFPDSHNEILDEKGNFTHESMFKLKSLATFRKPSN